MIFGQSISLPQFGNWGKFEVENTGAPSWILPQIGNWGKNLSWSTGVKSFLNWGTSVTNNEFAPIPNWAKSNLGHRCFNFELAPILNWGNVQLGAPVTSTSDLPQFRTGAKSNLGHR